MSNFVVDATSTGFSLPEIGRILCCLCGASIVPNEAAMCQTCLKVQYQSEFPKSYEIELTQCSKCDKWHHKQSLWIAHEPESPELLSFCLKKIPFFSNPSNNSIKILDSNWIWTEPHSKRLKLYVNYEHKLTNYQSLAITNQIQSEFIIKNKQCMECIYENNDHKWNAMIQLRAFTASSSVSSMISNALNVAVLNTHIMSKVFYQIETLLIQSKLYQIILDIETVNMSTQRSSNSDHHNGQHKQQANAVTNGLNLYFAHKNQAERVTSFLSEYFPLIIKTSKKVISSDLKNHTSRYEHIILMELLPVNRHDLLVIPKQLHGKFDLMLVTKISSMVHGINPRTLHPYSISVTKYCQYAFPTIVNEKYLTPFIVLDITPIYHDGEGGGSGSSVYSTSASVASEKSNAKKKRHNHKKVNKSDVWLAGDKKKPGITSNNETSTTPVSEERITQETKDDPRSVMSVMSGMTGSKWQLAEVVVAKESDLGENDTTYTTLTHLGNILQAGDTVLGYDLLHAVLGTRQEYSLKNVREADVPDVVLVKKVFLEKDKKYRKRKNRIPPWRRNKTAGDSNKDQDVVVEENTEEQGEEEVLEEVGEGEEFDEEFEELLDHLQEERLETIIEYDENLDEEGDENEDDEAEDDDGDDDVIDEEDE